MGGIVQKGGGVVCLDIDRIDRLIGAKISQVVREKASFETHRDERQEVTFTWEVIADEPRQITGIQQLGQCNFHVMLLWVGVRVVTAGRPLLLMCSPVSSLRLRHHGTPWRKTPAPLKQRAALDVKSSASAFDDLGRSTCTVF